MENPFLIMTWPFDFVWCTCAHIVTHLHQQAPLINCFRIHGSETSAPSRYTHLMCGRSVGVLSLFVQPIRERFKVWAQKADPRAIDFSRATGKRKARSLEEDVDKRDDDVGDP